MRARIRALSAVLAVIGLVAPVPTFAQDPPTATVSTPQARTAVPPGGTLNLSLDEAVQRALENNADIAVERYNPELSVQTVFSSEGYYDPYLFGNLSKTSTDTKGTNAFAGGDGRQHEDRRVELRPRHPDQDRSQLHPRLQQQQAGHQQHVQHVQPGLQLQPQHRRHPAASEELQDRQPPEPAETRQEGPRDHRRAVSPDDRQHRGRSEGALLRADLLHRQPRRGAEEPRAGQEAARRERDPGQGRDHGPARRGQRAVRGGQPRGRRHRRRQRPLRGRGQPEADAVPAQRPGHVVHPHRPHGPTQRRPGARERRRRGAQRARLAHRRRCRAQEPRALRIQRPVHPEPAAPPDGPRGQLRGIRRRRDRDPARASPRGRDRGYRPRRLR